MIKAPTYDKYDDMVFKRLAHWHAALDYEKKAKEKSIELNKREDELKKRKQKLEQEKECFNLSKVKLAYKLLEKKYDLTQIARILNCKIEDIKNIKEID